MAGVYIPKMRMPDACYSLKKNTVCPLLSVDDSRCALCTKEKTPPPDVIPEYCPLVEVPNHGRLVDADALIGRLKPATFVMESNAIGTWGEIWAEECREISDMPTILPTENKG